MKQKSLGVNQNHLKKMKKEFFSKGAAFGVFLGGAIVLFIDFLLSHDF